MNLTKYIFLCFDGPLNTERTIFVDQERYGHPFDELAVRNLRRVVKKTGAKIVVTSCWQNLGLEKMREMWSEWGMPGEIAGCTSERSGEEPQFNSKGEEIQHWLDKNVPEDDYLFVVFDSGDYSEATAELCQMWRTVNPLCGISYYDSEFAIDVLNYYENKTSRNRRMKIILLIIAILFIGKALWVVMATYNVRSFETEKKDILRRRNFLMEKVITSPQKLVDRMPSAVGEQFQGEWALYSCSMLSASLVNIAYLYPEEKDRSLEAIDSLIKIVMSPELRRYDYLRWGEDPLETLAGNNSHISYLSHLAWMIAGYKQIGGDGRYDSMYRSICETMNRRLLASKGLNLQTYPGEQVYIPDMLVAIVALKLYSLQSGGEYRSTVEKWLNNMKENHLSNSTGLMASMVMPDSDKPNCLSVKGSYTALSCYYLTFVDKEFAKGQYEKFKAKFLKKRPVTGFKEYMNRSPLLAFDIDAGPILLGISPSGTAFGIGPVTFFEDSLLRKKLLLSGELAGSTITIRRKSHYLLTDIALVGEAITLAMRTATMWN